MMFAFRRLRDSIAGASMVELALAAPFLATLLLGMVEVSRAYSDRLFLEQAAQRTIEKIEQQRSVSSDYGTMASEAATAAGVATNQVAIHYWLECNGVKQAPQDDTTVFSAGCANATDVYSRYVTVHIQKDFTPIFSTKYLGTNNDGTYTLTADSGIRVQ
jgi:Flp pilus assembly protein TadG